MKTTIKTRSRQIIVQPSPAVPGNVLLMVFASEFDPPSAITLTQDQAGALIFALEQAAEAAKVAEDNRLVAA